MTRVQAVDHRLGIATVVDSPTGPGKQRQLPADIIIQERYELTRAFTVPAFVPI
jgi:hypothetical protein